MNEQKENQIENIEETVKIGTEDPKEEEDTIEQANKQILMEKEKNEEEQEENINIVRDNNPQEDKMEKKNDKKKEATTNNQVQTNPNDKKNYKNLTIQNNNFNISTHANTNLNTKNNQTTKANKKNKTQKNFYLNKFENYNDELKRYYFNKEYSNFHINIEENFMERMQFDIYKRQIKEERLNDLVEQNKVKIDEDQKIKTFNRLIEDANRRLKAQTNMNELQNQLNDDLISATNFYKRYNGDEWDEIYKKRFKKYLEKVNKKKEENKKIYDEEKKKKEQEIINLCPCKKASIKHILEASQKMYDEAKKRKLKKSEKKETTNNIKKISYINTKLKNNNEEKDKDKEKDNTKKGNECKNNIVNQFLMNNINSNENKKLRKNKSSKKVVLTNKIIPLNDKIRNNGYTPNKYNSNFRTKKLCNKINNSVNLLINNISNEYNLEEERNVLIQMKANKILPQFKNINRVELTDYKNIKNKNKINITENNNSSYNKQKMVTESDKIIEEFFIRNLK